MFDGSVKKKSIKRYLKQQNTATDLCPAFLFRHTFMGTVICVSINLFNCLMCTKELIVVVATKQL